MEQFISGYEEGIITYCQQLLERNSGITGDVLMAIHDLPVNTAVRCGIYDSVVRTACPPSAEVHRNAINIASAYIEL